MYRFRHLVGILIAIGIMLPGLLQADPVPEADLPDFTYVGKRHSPEIVELVRETVQSILPQAVRQAESLVAMDLDRERVDLFLQDIPATHHEIINKMIVTGINHPILGVYIETVLRGDFHDSDALLLTLTHEMIHVLVRQNIDHADYTRLPEWFQEGIPHFLLDQLADKMVTKVAIEYENPYAVLGGFDGEHFALPGVTGGFFFAELEARVGREGVQEFIHGVLATASVELGLEAVSLLDAEMSEAERNEALAALWSGARSLALATLETHTAEVAGPFFECMGFYNRGSQDKGAAAIACFEELIAAHPGSYAAEVSLYWLAKCHFRRREAELALKGMEAFAAYRLNYGMLDNSLYFRIRLYEDLGLKQELEDACRFYLEFFPDGADLARVRKISSK